MDFRIADTFTDSLARMTPDEQKAVIAEGIVMAADIKAIREASNKAEAEIEAVKDEMI